MGHLTPPGVGMLVATGAVKAAQADFVPGEMRGHPIQNDANAHLVQPVNERHQFLGLPITGSGRIVPCNLISPGAVKGMLHYRQQFHMGIPHVRQVRDQLIGNFRVGKQRFVLVPPPGPQMHLIDIHGAMVRVPLGPLGHPGLILPGIAGKIAEHGGGIRPQLHAETIGIGLLMPGAVLSLNCIFIHQQLFCRIGVVIFLGIGGNVKGGSRKAYFPRTVKLLDHGVRQTIPLAKFTYQGYQPRIGRPYGKMPHLNPIL